MLVDGVDFLPYIYTMRKEGRKGLIDTSTPLLVVFLRVILLLYLSIRD